MACPPTGGNLGHRRSKLWSARNAALSTRTPDSRKATGTTGVVKKMLVPMEIYRWLRLSVMRLKRRLSETHMENRNGCPYPLRRSITGPLRVAYVVKISFSVGGVSVERNGSWQVCKDLKKSRCTAGVLSCPAAWLALGSKCRELTMFSPTVWHRLRSALTNTCK